VRLSSRVSGEELCECLGRLCDGAVYSRRDELIEGFVTLPDGVRVGIGGRAGYDGERLVGVSDIRSLVFRIPTGECEFIDELFEIYSGGIGRGMLIYSPPGVGKTTALRALAHRIGSGRDALRVAVVDERCEFSEGDYSGCEVDILRGYKRREGVEIATRTLSPGLIMIDEIGAEDADQLMTVVRCGIPMIATAHASSFEEVMAKPSLQRILSSSVFSVFVGLSRLCGKYILSVDRI
jgi:stage III sporulation protein AA